MRKIKHLKYSINSKTKFKGIPLFRKLRKVNFLKSDKLVAEFLIDENKYVINFANSEKIEIYYKNEIDAEFKITELINNRTWTLYNPNKSFSINDRSPNYLLESSNEKIEINIHNQSDIYLIDKKIIGRIEDKNILFKNGNYRIDIFNEKYEKILISACCIKLIDYHILKTYETND